MIVRLDKECFAEPKNGGLSVASKVKLVLEKGFPGERFVVCRYQPMTQQIRSSFETRAQGEEWPEPPGYHEMGQ